MNVFYAIVTICFLAVVSMSQTSVSIKGRVTANPSAAAASVVLKKGSAVVAKTATDSDGNYLFENVADGEYTIYVEPVDENSYRTKRKVVVLAGNPVIADFDVGPVACGLRPCEIRETVTISADSSQPLEEVSKTVNVIDGQQMRDRADITLVDSLRTIPGFRVQQLGGFGRLATIKSRGLRNQDTAILIDGMRFRDAASITGDASAFLSDLTLTSVSKVEVLRGPGSSLYGTNAIGGTVDFQTPVPQSGWHGQVGGAFGGLGLGRFRGNLSKGTSDGKFGFNVALSRTAYNKGIDGEDNANNTNFQARVELRPFEKTNISVRFFVSDASVRLNSSPDTVFGGVQASNSSIIDAEPGVNFEFDINDPDSIQKSNFFNGQVVLTHAFTNRLIFQGHYAGLKTKRTNDNGILGIGFQSASTSVFDGTIQTANGHLDWTPNDSNRVTAGYEFEHEKYGNEGFTPSGSGDFFTNAYQTSHTFFAQDLIRLLGNKLQFSGGFRTQFLSLKDPDFSSANAPYQNLTLENPPSAFTLDGSASYYFQKSATKLRMHIGNGYRVPSLYERFGSYFSTFGIPGFFPLGAPDLKPEKTVAFDAGIEQSVFKNRAKLTATYFYTRLIDTIGYDNSATSFERFGGYINTKGGIARGFELSGDLRPTSSTDIFVSYTYTNSDQREPQAGGTNILSTLGVPSNQFTAVVTQRIKRFWVTFDLLATSDYLASIFDTNNVFYQTYVYRFDGNRRADLTAGYTFSLNKDKFSLRVFGTIENLFDYDYFENGFRTAGINGRVGVSFGF
ncbi:MAG: TonB-dependent receptor [Pyrinomonadaceae bacterium]